MYIGRQAENLKCCNGFHENFIVLIITASQRYEQLSSTYHLLFPHPIQLI